MLDVAILNTVLRQFGEVAPQPERNSKTSRFTRLEKFSVPTSPSQLVEGIPPDADPLTIAQFEVTVEQQPMWPVLLVKPLLNTGKAKAEMPSLSEASRFITVQPQRLSEVARCSVMLQSDSGRKPSQPSTASSCVSPRLRN